MTETFVGLELGQRGNKQSVVAWGSNCFGPPESGLLGSCWCGCNFIFFGVQRCGCIC